MEKFQLFIVLIPTRFPPFLPYVRCKSGVTFLRRCFRDLLLQIKVMETGMSDNHDGFMMAELWQRTSTDIFSHHLEILNNLPISELFDIMILHEYSLTRRSDSLI